MFYFTYPFTGLIEKRRAQSYTQIREFKLPKEKINFNANSYHELIDFTTFDMSEWVSPPLLDEYDKFDIENFGYKEDFMAIPNHSQAVEYYVNLTSKSAKHVIGYQQRHSWIINAEESYQKYPSKPIRAQFRKLLKMN